MAGKLYIRRIVMIVIDMAITSLSYFVAYNFILKIKNQGGFENYSETFFTALPWLLLLRFLCGHIVRQYTWAFKQASLVEAVSLCKAAVLGSALFYVLCNSGMVFSGGDLMPPRSTYITELFISLTMMGVVRFSPRYFYQLYMSQNLNDPLDGVPRVNTLICGAGDTGAMILKDILQTNIYPYNPVGLVDENPAKWHTSIQGFRVLGAIKDIPSIIKKHNVGKILIADPSVKGAVLRKVVDICADKHIQFKIVPTYNELVTRGNSSPVMLKDIQPEDLLDRKPIKFDHEKMLGFLEGKTVLVTGAAGSIGSEICRQIVSHKIKRLIAFDLNENGLYFLRMDINDISPDTEIRLEVGSIRDKSALERIFKAYSPEIVFHAAAHKHVPLVEMCPMEGLKNNLLGTRNVAGMADKYCSERFVLISTDKAVSPSNVMGATKSLAEAVVRDLNGRSKTRFMAVRFGNVLGSNGSLVQILKRQILKGGPVTITHKDITRFFMTIPEAVGLVLVAAQQAEGALCILDMGEPLSVDNLAREMISLYGLIPGTDIEIVYTGLRPGEKMYEELFTKNESNKPSTHPRIFIASSDKVEIDVEKMVSAAKEIIELEDESRIEPFLNEFVEGYTPDDTLKKLRK